MADILKTFLENEKALRAYLGRFLSCPKDIEDVTQETFLKTFAADAKSEIRAPKSFLFTVAKHTALNENSKKCNSATVAVEDFEDTTVLIDKSQVGADDILDGKRKLFVFAQAVANLPPKCRQVFLLRKMEGMKVKEIARTLDISVSGVEKHIATGLVKCSQYFKENGYDPAEFGAMPRASGDRVKKAIAALLDVNDE